MNIDRSEQSAPLSPALAREACAVVRLFMERRKQLAAAESFTGGLIAHTLTNVDGASRVLTGAVVAYTIKAKVLLLGMDPLRIEQGGEVSAATARGMAEGMLKAAQADAAVATTGYAGPGWLAAPAGAEAATGHAFIAVAAAGAATEVREYRFAGSREEIKAAACLEALGFLKERALVLWDMKH